VDDFRFIGSAVVATIEVFILIQIVVFLDGEKVWW